MSDVVERTAPVLKDGEITERLSQFRMRWQEGGDLLYLGKALVDAITEIASLRAALHDSQQGEECGKAVIADLRAELAKVEGVLGRCRTVLGNMAQENEGAIFNRWPIHHEPLRSDARNLLPLIDEVLGP